MKEPLGTITEVLPPYRRVGLRGQTRTPQDNIVEHLTEVLGQYGRVLQVTADESGYVDAELEPPTSPDDCIAALKATVDTYWDEVPEGPSWQHTVNGPTFLHPDMDWATLSAHEAPVLPRFAEGDHVRIVSSTKYPDVVGATATVGLPCYSYSDERWLYLLQVDGRPGPYQLAEPELSRL